MNHNKFVKLLSTLTTSSKFQPSRMIFNIFYMIELGYLFVHLIFLERQGLWTIL